MMDELKTRLRALLEELEVVHLTQNWAEQLKIGGVSEEDSTKWVTELRCIVDEYRLSIEYIINIIKISDVKETAEAVEKWLDYTYGVSSKRISDALTALEENIEKYMPPPDPEDEDE